MALAKTAAAAAAAARRPPMITKLLTSPRIVANALDWRKASGSILALAISKNRLDLAVSWHPSYYEDPLLTLPSIPLQKEVVNHEASSSKAVLRSSVAEELSDIVHRFSVCGMVVSWPVQKEGWCGAACGRVLYTLDQLVATTQNNKTLLIDRPLCLWDEKHFLPPEDEWGRAAIYAGRRRPSSNKTIHQASIEQYGDRDTAVADLWNDFCQTKWPELYGRDETRSIHAIKKADETSRRQISPDLAWLHTTSREGSGNSRKMALL